MSGHEHTYDYDKQVGPMSPAGVVTIRPMCGCGQAYGPDYTDQVL